MKLSLIALMFTLTAIQVQAEPLPATVEAKMIEAVLDRCSISTSAEFTLVSLQKKVSEFDQGQFDVTYDAIFSTQAYGVDEETIVTENVRVIGTEYGISNPGVENFEIDSVTSPTRNLCD